jgi:hypothetical protein
MKPGLQAALALCGIMKAISAVAAASLIRLIAVSPKNGS